MRPTHGFTRLGHPVHAKVADHHPADTRYQRLNKRVALALTSRVGTMTCAWVFCIIALCSLPATLVAARVIPATTVGLLGAAGFMLCVSWIAQSFLQLVLLPALMVGQNLQNEAADARAAKTFEDVEKVLDALDLHTAGGLADLKTTLDRIAAKTGA